MRTTSRGLPPAPAALSRAKTKRGSRPGIAQRGVASGRAHSASMESECALDSCVRAYPFRETTQIGCFRFAYINAPISGKPDTRKSDVSDLRTLNGPISGKPDTRKSDVSDLRTLNGPISGKPDTRKSDVF